MLWFGDGRCYAQQRIILVIFIFTPVFKIYFAGILKIRVYTVRMLMKVGIHSQVSFVGSCVLLVA